MAILLTGGSGFIGRNLIELMGEKHELVAPNRRELDLLDEEAVKKFLLENKIEIVIHSATTPGHRNAPVVADLVARNLRMFFNLARNKLLFGKMIYLGSGAVYDARHYRPKMGEDYFDTHVPVDVHGFSKYVIAKYVEKEPSIIELRLFGIFGKYEDYSIRFISNAICKALLGLPITLKQNRRFDYVYVNDLVPVLEYFMANQPDNNTYNVTPNQAIDLLEIAEKVQRLSGVQSEIIVDQQGSGLEYSGDNSRLRAEMPNLQLTPIDTAIEDLFDWYSRSKQNLNKELLLVDR